MVWTTSSVKTWSDQRRSGHKEGSATPGAFMSEASTPRQLITVAILWVCPRRNQSNGWKGVRSVRQDRNLDQECSNGGPNTTLFLEKTDFLIEAVE
ncbi:hypothetical protein H8959_021975 [Pygathrix nigripes]